MDYGGELCALARDAYITVSYKFPKGEEGSWSRPFMSS